MSKGRPRTKAARLANGRLSRSKVARCFFGDETEAAATRTALEARERLFLVPSSKATDPRVASVVGRLTMAGRINDDHYDAAMYWLACRTASLRALDAPGLPREPRDGIGPLDDDEAAERASAARNRYIAICRWLADTPVEPGERHAMLAALVIMVAEDEYAEHLVDALKMALHLVDQFKRDGRRK
jgi:hypothetical protein